MSGHSKWTQIKHKKAATDAKRGQVFTKIAREITVAARQGGGDPNINVRLRFAVQKGREANMPVDNIERAIKRGAGAGDGAGEKLEEVTYEGYGPGGVAIMLQVVTDNRNRAVSEVRTAFSRGGGSLGEAGSVAWVFDARGVVTVEGVDEAKAEELGLAAIDAGAEDVSLDGDFLELYCDPEHFEAVRRTVESHVAKVATAELSMVPKSTVPLGVKEAEQTLRLLERLEELEDVQRVFTNADFPDEALERYRSQG